MTSTNRFSPKSALACVWLALGGAAAWAQTPAPSTAPAPSPAALPNAVTLAAVQQGVLSCSSRINQVSSFLGFDAQAGAMLMAPPAQPDQRLIPIAMEIPTEGGSAYVSANFAPNQANGCGASYDAVVYWPERCDAVAARRFAAMKRVGELKKGIAMLDGGIATKVFLMTAGSGCVSIKKEVVL